MPNVNESVSDKKNSLAEIIMLKLKNIRYLVFSLFLIILFARVLVAILVKDDAYNWILITLDAVWPPLLSMLVIEFWMNQYTRNEAKKELEIIVEEAIKQTTPILKQDLSCVCDGLLRDREANVVENLKKVCRDLYTEKDPMLVSFNNNKLTVIVRNALTLLVGKDLADEFTSSVIEKLIGNKSYRTDFSYDVTFSKNNAGQQIEQEVSYRKCFKRKDVIELPKSVVALFCFGKDPFEGNLSPEDMIFFSEELPRGEFVDEIIRNAGNSKKIIELLNFKMWIKSEEEDIACKAEVIYTELKSKRSTKVPKYVKISANIQPGYWSNLDIETSCVWCKLNCKYPSEQKNFYWKFGEPIIGKVSPINFNLSFNNGVKGTDVKYIKYFSGSNYNKEKKDLIPKEDRIKYSSYGIYFPESGIYFHW